MKKNETATEKKSVNLREISEGRKDILLIDPRKIQMKEGFNIREDYGDMKELENSIRENGVLNPITIFTENGNIFVSNGHRRFKAVQKLIEDGFEIKNIPCIAEPKGISQEDLVARTLIHNDGKPLTPLEEAHGIVRLMNFGWSVADICKKIGRTQGHVSNAKALVGLPKEVQKEIQAENISSSLALELARECGEDHEKLKKTVKEAKDVAASLGKKKVTKKIAKKKTTKRTSRKAEKQKLVDLLTNAVKAIRDDETVDKADVAEELEDYIATLVDGAAVANAK